MYEGMNNKREQLWNNQIFLFHMVVAFMCWPLYWTLPWIFGVLLSPYIIFLVSKPRQEYLLPLILHTWYGSQQRYFMLATCFLYAIVHYRQMRTLGVHILFFVYSLFIPFFIWYTYARISAFHSILTGGIYEGISYYFSFAPFFWAVLSFRRIDKRFYWWLIIVSFIIVLRGFFLHGSGDDSLLTGKNILSYTRFHSWGAVYVVAVCVWAFLTKQDFKIKVVSLLGSLLVTLGFLHIGRSLIPFHLAGASIFASCIICGGRLFRRYPKILNPCIFIVIATILVFWVVTKYENKELTFDRVKYDEISVRNIDNFVLRLENKLYGDRAPVWTASMDAVKQQISKSWFFVNPHSVAGEIYRDNGMKVMIELQAHNMFLEALRLYGIFGGGGILITFFLLAGQKRIRRSAVNLKMPHAPVAAAAIGHLVFGYWGGQYLMIPAFSFTLYSLIGVCYRNQLENDKLQGL